MGASPDGADLLGDAPGRVAALCCGLGAGADENIRAGLGESQRDGRPEAAAATGDDGDFVVETEPVQDHCGLFSSGLSADTVASHTAAVVAFLKQVLFFQPAAATRRPGLHCVPALDCLA